LGRRYRRPRHADQAVICAQCGRQPRGDENAADEWRCYSDGVGELIVFCPECVEREFGTGKAHD
jgi:hypothetical protein